MKVSEDVAWLNPGVFGDGREAPTRIRARTAPGELKFKSKLEARAWREWVPLQGAVRALYEPFVLHLTGGNYTPDIVLQMPAGELWLIEVKGSWKAHGSGRSSKRNLKQAAAEFAWLGRWFALLPDGRRDWTFTEVAP